MRKLKLLELLNNIKGNPDIVLWNNSVGDWTNIKALVPGDLVKQSLPYFLETCRMEKAVDKKDWETVLSEQETKECVATHRRMQYETNVLTSEADIKEGRWKRKNVLFIEPLRRGITSYGRGGDIDY